MSVGPDGCRVHDLPPGTEVWVTMPRRMMTAEQVRRRGGDGAVPMLAGELCDSTHLGAQLVRALAERDPDAEAGAG